MTVRIILSLLAALAIATPIAAQPVSVELSPSPAVIATCQAIMVQFPVVKRCLALPSSKPVPVAVPPGCVAGLLPTGRPICNDVRRP